MPWTTADIPHQAGRVAIVTGSNSGLGLETARELARSGAQVVLAVRNLERGEAAAADIRSGSPSAQVELLRLDLSSLASVREAASEVESRFDAVDLLINNAGVMYTPKSTTADGFEMQFGTNHLGHFAFTGLVLDRLLPVAGARIVTVSSLAHGIRSKIDFDDLQAERSYSRVAAYGRSKLANLLFTYELQRRLAAAGSSVAALAAHPGVSSTELGRHIPGEKFFRPLSNLMTQPATAGALPTLRAATDPDAIGGQYYGPNGFQGWRGDAVVVASNSLSHDEADQARLWSMSEDLTGVTFSI